MTILSFFRASTTFRLISAFYGRSIKRHGMPPWREVKALLPILVVPYLRSGRPSFRNHFFPGRAHLAVLSRRIDAPVLTSLLRSVLHYELPRMQPRVYTIYHCISAHRFLFTTPFLHLFFNYRSLATRYFLCMRLSFHALFLCLDIAHVDIFILISRHCPTQIFPGYGLRFLYRSTHDTRFS